MNRFTYSDGRNRSSAKRGPNSNPLFNNIFTRLGLLAISVFLLYNVGHSISITVQKLDILQRAKREVDELRLKNLELALLLDNIQGVEYLEIQARDRLKFSGEGEYVFVIPEEVLDDTQEDLEKILNVKENSKERKVSEIWVNFFTKGV